MIQDYLNSNLLSITDDGDFKKLKKSSDEIAKKLLKNKAKIISYTLAAIDPDVSADNADIVEVKENIIKNWSTFIVNSKDTPFTFIRAVMLEALDVVADDITNAILIWLSSRNIVKYYKLTGDEKRIILDFLKKQGDRINTEANNSWAILKSGSLSKTSIDLKEISKYLVNDDTLQKHLEDASGPSNVSGIANFDSPNPYWSNQQTHWSHEFAPRAAKGIKSTIDSSLKAIVTIINDNQKVIQAGINNSLEKLQKELSEKSKSLQLKSELLWWKEARYSTSTDKSYNELSDEILSIVTAYDYSTFIPIIYPRSVDYFLQEMYKNLKSEASVGIEIGKLIELIKSGFNELPAFLPEVIIETGKISLLTFIIGFLDGKYNLKQFETMLGLHENTKLTPVDFTIWLFHDFQLLKALKTK